MESRDVHGLAELYGTDNGVSPVDAWLGSRECQYVVFGAGR